MDWIVLAENTGVDLRRFDIVQAQAKDEDHLIDHRELYEECERRYGKALHLAMQRSYWKR